MKLNILLTLVLIGGGTEEQLTAREENHFKNFLTIAYSYWSEKGGNFMRFSKCSDIIYPWQPAEQLDLRMVSSTIFTEGFGMRHHNIVLHGV